jgi:hypothetical protein
MRVVGRHVAVSACPLAAEVQPPDQRCDEGTFDGFFAAIGKVFRASLGDEWTAAIDQPGGAR